MQHRAPATAPPSGETIRATERWCSRHLPHSTPEIIAGAANEGSLMLGLQMLGNESTTRAMVAGFQQRFPFIDVGWTNGYAIELQPMLVAQFESGQGTHDHVQISSNMNEAARLRDTGVLKHFVVSQDASYSESAKCAGYWYARTRTPVVTIYRKGALSAVELQLIRTYEGLGNPCFRGRLGILDVSATMAALVAYLLAYEKPPGLLEGIAVNQPKVRTTGGPLVEGLLAGEYDVAVLGPLGTAVQAARTGAPVEFICSSPSPRLYGALGVISSVAPHPHAAMLWADWSTSKEGSELFAHVTGHLSPRVDAQPSWAEQQPWYFEDAARAVSFDWADFERRQAEIVAHFRSHIPLM